MCEINIRIIIVYLYFHKIALINEQKRLQLPMEYLRMGFIGGSPAVPELFKRIDESFHIDNMMVNLNKFIYYI